MELKKFFMLKFTIGKSLKVSKRKNFNGAFLKIVLPVHYVDLYQNGQISICLAVVTTVLQQNTYQKVASS